MKDRIQKILEHYDLTSTQFADEIGVQRSSVSHVLTGRNKPGFDFIQKIIGTFPEISAEWLITGVGRMIKTVTNESNELFDIKKEEKDISVGEVKGSGNTGSILHSEPRLLNEHEPVKKRAIKKIIVFYDDKSFDEFLPGLTSL